MFEFIKTWAKSIQQKSWYPTLRDHVVSAWHTFAAAFLLALVVQYKQTNLASISLSLDAISALSIAVARVCVKAGLQAMFNLINSWLKPPSI